MSEIYDDPFSVVDTASLLLLPLPAAVTPITAALLFSPFNLHTTPCSRFAI